MAYGSCTPLPLLGKFEATFKTHQRYTVATIHVTKGQHGCLLSFNTATKLNLLAIHVNHLAESPSTVEQLELDKLKKAGIIEDIKGPTPWISALVVVSKPNGNIRLCVNMRRPNKVILRERHANPTVDDVIHALIGATMLSKLDFRCGYHQISLSEKKSLCHGIFNA
eukprot:gene20679-22718_t